MRTLVTALLVAGALGGAHWWLSERPVQREAGIMAPDAPAQTAIDPPTQFAFRGFTISRRATFDVDARVLRKERYRIDTEAGLAPLDIGVGWGPASDSRIIDQLEFSQMGRFFYWQPKSASFPLSQADLVRHIAQIHAIPATDDVAKRLDSLKAGSLITAHGYLVDVRGPGGFVWNTSLTRDDTGAGACEIFWIESVDRH